jgi:tetratricopeptide (TPR) repeat protein
MHIIASSYRESIDEYPGNAAAFIGLANAMIFAALHGIMDPSTAYPCAQEALRRMPQLDAEYIDAKCVSGWIDLLIKRKWRQARACFELVLSKRPLFSFALSGLALSYVAEDNLGQATHYAQKAWKHNMLSCPLAALLCWTHYLSGEQKRVLEQVGEVRSSGGCGTTIFVVEALALIQTDASVGCISRLEELVSESPQSITLQGVLGYAYATLGRSSKAHEILSTLEQMGEQKKRTHGYALALVLLGFNRRQEAIECLEIAYAEGTLWSLGLRSDPILLPLHGEPRFELLRRKIGYSSNNNVWTAPPLKLLAWEA